jgi:hypothetical protein
LEKIHFCSKIWELEIFWCLKIFRRMFFQDAQKYFGQFWNLNCLGGFFKVQKTIAAQKNWASLEKPWCSKVCGFWDFLWCLIIWRTLKVEESLPFCPNIFWALCKKSEGTLRACVALVMKMQSCPNCVIINSHQKN